MNEVINTMTLLQNPLKGFDEKYRVEANNYSLISHGWVLLINKLHDEIFISYLDKYQPHLSKGEKRRLYINNFSADFFISGVNAVCMDGTIFNLDGNGSRVAPMIYGPGKVFLIAGLNKVVADADAAYERIRTIAAPLDNIRLGKPNPCVKTGTCMDCKSKTKICNYFSKIQGQFDGNRIHLLLLKGKYGY